MSISINGSVSSLERSAESLKRLLEKRGFEVEIDVFKCGHGGSAHYGPSYVELTISNDEVYSSHKVYAGGYSDVLLWSDIKKAILSEVGEK